MDTYEIQPRKDHRGVDLMSNLLSYGRRWYFEPNAVDHAISYAKHRSRSHAAVIRVYDEVLRLPRSVGHPKATAATK